MDASGSQGNTTSSGPGVLAGVPSIRRSTHILAGTGVCTAVCSPLLFSDRAFWYDWSNALWVLWSAPPLGSLFLHNLGLGVFYPQYAFYGGPLYELGGLLADLVGGRPVEVYVALWAGAVGGAYASIYGLARRLGVSPTFAHAPAVLYVTAPYALTNMYGRGAFSEFVAASSIPVLLYGAVSYCSDEHPRWRSLVAVAVGVYFLTGSHMITLFYALVLLAPVGLGCAVAVGRRTVREWYQRRRGRIGPVLATAAGTTALNAWYLVPGVALSSTTRVPRYVEDPEASTVLSALDIVLSPFPRVSALSTTPALYLQAPIALLAWSALALVYTGVTRRDALHGRLVGWFTVVAVVLLGLLSSDLPWRVLPSLFDIIQYPYRLLSFVSLVSVALCIAAVRSLDAASPRRFRLAAASLAVAVAWSTGVAVWQAWSSPSTSNVRVDRLVDHTALPETWRDPAMYRTAEGAVVRVPQDRGFGIHPVLVRGDRYSELAYLPEGPEPFVTNIAAGPRILDFDGIVPVGRTRFGTLVVRRDGSPSGPLPVTIALRQGSLPSVARRVSVVVPTLIALPAIGVRLRLLVRTRRSREAGS